MKTMTLILIAGIALAGCQQEAILYEDPTEGRYDIEFVSAFERISQGGGTWADSGTIKMNVGWTGDYLWKVDLFGFPHSGFGNTATIYPESSYFDVAFVSLGDTIYGTGYIAQDTFWLNYTYQNLEDTSEYGFVNIHSVYER